MEERLHEKLRPQTVQVYCAPICRLLESKTKGTGGGGVGYIDEYFRNSFICLRCVQKILIHDNDSSVLCRKQPRGSGWVLISRHDRRVSAHVSFIIMSQINLRTCVFFNQRAQASLLWGGDTWEETRWAVAPADLGMVWRDMTPICAQHPRCEDNI